MEAAGPSEAKSGKQKIQPGTTTADAGDKDTPKDEVVSEEGEEEEEEEDDDGEDDEDDVEDEEPRLKYAPITPVLGPLYRNKDATSTFMTAGNKMVCSMFIQWSRLEELVLTKSVVDCWNP